MFDGAQLRLLLLKLIADEPRHGYSLIKAIEELSGGDYAPSAGVVYPTLSLMVDEGLLVQSDEDGGRRSFTITDAGTAELADKAEDVEAVLERLKRHGERRASGAPIRRSVKNLMTAVFHQAAHGADEDKLNAIVDLIDETARKIERL
jgi:DNA-binding PadR family transcriptional regulator